MTSQSTDKEVNLSMAIEDAKSIGIRGSARKHGLGPSTLKDRIEGATDIHTAKEKTQKLSPLQEKDIAKRILQREAFHMPANKSEIRAFASAIAKEGGDDKPVGKHWVNRFFTRHEEVKMKPSRLIDAARKKAVTEEGLREHWRGLGDLFDDCDIEEDRLYNVDETGVKEGETQAGKVAGTLLTTAAEAMESDSTAWITILECGSADGRRLTPCVVFTGHNLQGQWFPKEIPEWKYDCSPSGWSTADIFLKWFELVFLPETKPKKPDQWRILVLDQHKTHITGDLMKTAWKSKVWLSWLPSHSSHLTQPLDVAVFGPLKVFYHEETRGWAIYSITSPRQKQLFVSAYKRASMKAMTEKNIRAGFRASGIYPLDVTKALAGVKKLKVPKAQKAGPSTPKNQIDDAPGLWNTPHCGRDIERQVEQLNLGENESTRGIRRALKKAQDCADRDNYEIIYLRQEVALLKAKAAAEKPSGRKPVQFDPNKAFPQIHKIIDARDEAENQVKKRKATSTRKPARKRRKKSQTVDSAFFS
ncbi:hypothetical protein MRS44_017635 [Fusarium solani]|uniref:uncharacterized protein n=1 Tax=Fusarium solani TaxID=169388 RepID=UPI0032C40488|nr:hypothetical protein MRS44_017635 [Fusarium solani]